MNKGKVFAKVLLKNLAKLPIYEIDFTNKIEKAAHDTIVTLVHMINERCGFEKIIDGIIFQLYFPDHMKDRGIDILQFVEEDLKEGIQGREFDQLTDGQKEKGINRLQARWTDPESEIVKRMNSFAEKSPDIFKPILESR